MSSHGVSTQAVQEEIVNDNYCKASLYNTLDLAAAVLYRSLDCHEKFCPGLKRVRADYF